MTTLQTEVERGHQARAIIDHPLWVESWDIWEAAIRQAWEDSSASDSLERETLFFALQAGRKARASIETVLETGKLATSQMEAENARSSRAKS